MTDRAENRRPRAEEAAKRKPDPRSVGRWGEREAAAWLRKRGWRILERNFTCRSGEIDIVAEDAGCLVFVEVKLRRSAEYALAREAVTPGKQQKLIRAAEYYLSRRDPDVPVRFDVIEVYGESGRVDAVNHIENAFQ